MSNQALATVDAAHVAQVGEIANAHASRAAFADYKVRKAANTVRRQHDDLADFARYLAAVQIERTADELQFDPASWQGLTWGVVAGYREWMARNGAAVGVINLRLSTVRTYAKLAAQAGEIMPDELALIRTVNGYSRKEGERVDEGRDKRRISNRKASANVLSPAQIKALRTCADTPQGRRDAVLIGLLVALGLRVGEVVSLRVGNVDTASNTLRFYRRKVGKWQTHTLRNGLAASLSAYLAIDHAGTSDDAPLLRSSRRGGKLTHAGMTRFAIAQRVAQLGRAIGVDNLSPHDLRHTWATRAAVNRTDAFALRDAGGWASLAMPARYVEAAAIANEGVKLDAD